MTADVPKSAGDENVASLQELRMPFCSIEDEGGIEMARVLPQAPEVLKTLDLHGNRFEDRTIHLLKAARARRNAQAKQLRREYKSPRYAVGGTSLQNNDDDFDLIIEEAKKAAGRHSREDEDEEAPRFSEEI